MKKTLLGFAVVGLAAAALGFAGQAAAQQQPAGTRVAVVDVTYILENHLRFKQEIEGMKKEVKDFDGFMQQEQVRIRKLAEALQEFNPTSPEFRQREEELARITNELKLQGQLKKRELLLDEAKTLADVYGEVTAEIQRFAQANRIDLVLNFDSAEIDPRDRGGVLRGVNRMVVFQNHLNITHLVLDRLNATAGGRPAPGLPPR